MDRLPPKHDPAQSLFYKNWTRADLYELLARNQYFLPAITARIVTLGKCPMTRLIVAAFLLGVLDGSVHLPMTGKCLAFNNIEDAIVYRNMYSQPPLDVLCAEASRLLDEKQAKLNVVTRKPDAVSPAVC